MIGLLAIFSLGSVMPTISLAEDAEIKVMVVYTEAAKTAAENTDGGDIDALINDIINSTNESFTNSKVTAKLTLVNEDAETDEMKVSDYNEDGKLFKDILQKDLTAGSGSMANVHDLREKYEADVVVLLVGGIDTDCGLSTSPDEVNVDSAFAVVKIDANGKCLAKEGINGEQNAFAHQLGHILGCEDDDAYYKFGKYCTIMYDYDADELCFRVNYWSNPTVKYGKIFIGDETHNCAAKIGTEDEEGTAKIVAGFFPKPEHGILQFSEGSRRVDEDSSEVEIIVERIDGTDGKVSVKVTISGGSATEGTDYDTDPELPIILTWDEGNKDSQTIRVSIKDDDIMEDDKDIVFTLSEEEGGATLGQSESRLIITDDDKANIAYVIDDTLSMDKEIAGVQQALNEHTKTLKEEEIVALFTFKDEVAQKIITDDLKLVQDEIDKLEADGGGSCPEATLEAVQAAAEKVRTGGTILLVTDASPGDAKIDETIEELAAKGITLEAVITGDCVGGLRRGKRNQNVFLSNNHEINPTTRRDTRDGKILSTRVVYPRIALETGGSFVYMPELNDGSELNAIKFKNSIFNIMSGTKSSTVTGVVPSTTLPASTLDLIINASKTNFNDSSSVSIGNGSITVNEVKLISATQIVANVTVPSGVLPSFYDVSVTTRLGTEIETANGRGVLQVIAPRGWSEILSVYPFIGINGNTIDIRLSGFDTDFDETTTIEFDWGIEIKEKNILSPTLMTATIEITPEATAGLQTVLVETGDQVAMLENAILVLPRIVNDGPIPKIAAIKPSQSKIGTTLELEISGQNTSFVSGKSFVDFSGGRIAVLSFNVIDTTHATATILIDSNATFGYRNVFVKTGNETAALLNGFEIATEVPEIIQVNPSYSSRGNSLEVEITGQQTNFLANDSVVKIEGSDVTVLSATVKSPTLLTANVQVDESAGIGGRNVSVSTGSEVAALRDGFNVMPKLAPAQKDPVRELKKAGLYSVLGRIVDKNGNPIEGVIVQVGDKTSTTGELGLWKIVTVEGSYTIVATKEGYTFTPQDVTLGNQNVITEVTITLAGSGELPDSYTVFGHIFNEDGNPMAGVAVKVGDQITKTDETGRWEIGSLEAGQYTVLAGMKLHTFTSPKVTLGGMVSTKEVKITLDSPGGSGDEPDNYTVYGTITDAEGNALAGVNVQVGDKTAVTDADGEWEVSDLLKGDYAIVASKEGYLSASKEVKLEESDDFKTEVTITLSKQVVVPINYTVYGTITDAEGNPVADVNVQVGDKTAVTDADGKWEITGLSEGNYEVIASKEGITFTQPNVTLDQESSQEVKLATVAPTGIYEASGTIKDKFKAPMEGVTVEVYSKKAMSAGPVATTVTDAAGNWEITTLFEDEYTVIASKDGYLFKTRDCFASENQACQPNLSNPDSVLNLTVAAQPRTVKQGENVTYLITVTNTDDGQTATNIVVSEKLPKNTQLVSMDGNCSGMTCTLPDLVPGDSANLTVVVSNDQAKNLTNTVTVTSDEFPADKETTWTKVLPYFSVSVSDQPDPVAIEGVVQYQVNVALSSEAPTVATGVELELLLPNGVELQAVNSDSAICDRSNLPKVTCSFADIEPANGASSVNLDVELKDLGLLLLIIEAKLSANEYPTHSVRERTRIDIPIDIEVDIAFVIDVTGSMQEEIDGVIKALKEFIATIDPNESPLIALVTFKDNVTYNAFTSDMTVLLTAIDKLKAKGGGACPEAAIEALKDITIPHVKKGGTILFVTDASPYDDADIEGTLELLRSKGIRFNAMITGDCSKESSWNF